MAHRVFFPSIKGRLSLSLFPSRPQGPVRYDPFFLLCLVTFTLFFSLSRVTGSPPLLSRRFFFLTPTLFPSSAELFPLRSLSAFSHGSSPSLSNVSLCFPPSPRPSLQFNSLSFFLSVARPAPSPPPWNQVRSLFLFFLPPTVPFSPPFVGC